MLTSVQPPIRLGFSFDQRSHTYLGCALRVRGEVRKLGATSGDMAILMPRSLYRCLGLKSDPYDLTWLDGLRGNEGVPEVRQQVFQPN